MTEELHNYYEAEYAEAKRDGDIIWNAGDVNGTFLRGGLMDITFTDLMNRVDALGGTNDACPDGHYENFFAYRGTFKGETFTIYDAFGIHIGGTDGLDVDGLIDTLTALLNCKTGHPTPAFEIVQMMGGVQ